MLASTPPLTLSHLLHPLLYPLLYPIHSTPYSIPSTPPPTQPHPLHPLFYPYSTPYSNPSLHPVASNTVESIVNQRVVLFSYGSGLASSMFSFKVTGDTKNPTLCRIVNNLADLQDRLNARTSVEPKQFEEMMKLRETTHHLGSLHCSVSYN